MATKKLSAKCISRRINRVIADSITQSSKRVILPEARRFSDVFSSVMPRPAGESALDLKVFQSDESKSTMAVKDTLYCGHHPFRIIPKRGLLNQLDLMFIEWDSLYWELTQRMNGTTLVTLRYNKIIGNRYIAIVRTDSLPACLRKRMMDEDR
jgi:hypothetical protein